MISLFTVYQIDSAQFDERFLQVHENPAMRPNALLPADISASFDSLTKALCMYLQVIADGDHRRKLVKNIGGAHCLSRPIAFPSLHRVPLYVGNQIKLNQICVYWVFVEKIVTEIIVADTDTIRHVGRDGALVEAITLNRRVV